MICPGIMGTYLQMFRVQYIVCKSAGVTRAAAAAISRPYAGRRTAAARPSLNSTRVYQYVYYTNNNNNEDPSYTANILYSNGIRSPSSRHDADRPASVYMHTHIQAYHTHVMYILYSRVYYNVYYRGRSPQSMDDKRAGPGGLPTAASFSHCLFILSYYYYRVRARVLQEVYTYIGIILHANNSWPANENSSSRASLHNNILYYACVYVTRS